MSAARGHQGEAPPRSLRDGGPAGFGGPTGLRRLYVDGGVTLQGFLGAGLIDRLIPTWIPVLPGEGIPLFGSLGVRVPLRLAGVDHASDGFVQTRHEVGTPQAP